MKMFRVIINGRDSETIPAHGTAVELQHDIVTRTPGARVRVLEVVYQDPPVRRRRWEDEDAD